MKKTSAMEEEGIVWHNLEDKNELMITEKSSKSAWSFLYFPVNIIMPSCI